MKTIRLIPSVVFSAASLAASLHAQEFREIPVMPDPKEEPLTMEKLFIEERKKQEGDRLPPMADEDLKPELESEKVQRQMMDRIQQHMLLEQAKPEGMQKPDWIIGLGVEPLDAFVREHLGIDENTGAKVTVLGSNLPAEAAGIKPNDIVLSADGRKITGTEELREIVDACGKAGRPVSLELLRRGEKLTIAVTPRSTRKPEPPAEARPERRFAEFVDRLERQEKQIRELQKEVRRLRRELKEERDDDQNEENE